jgi:hypothetical protein
VCKVRTRAWAKGRINGRLRGEIDNASRREAFRIKAANKGVTTG